MEIEFSCAPIWLLSSSYVILRFFLGALTDWRGPHRWSHGTCTTNSCFSHEGITYNFFLKFVQYMEYWVTRCVGGRLWITFWLIYLSAAQCRTWSCWSFDGGKFSRSLFRLLVMTPDGELNSVFFWWMFTFRLKTLICWLNMLIKQILEGLVCISPVQLGKWKKVSVHKGFKRIQVNPMIAKKEMRWFIFTYELLFLRHSVYIVIGLAMKLFIFLESHSRVVFYDIKVYWMEFGLQFGFIMKAILICKHHFAW